MDVFWFEQRTADLPASDNWLSERELIRARSFRFEKRAADWRLGRWTAKQAISRFLFRPRTAASLTLIEVIAADGGAPLAYFCGSPAACRISLSHSRDQAICAVSRKDASLGCDIETIEPRSHGFISDYFTDEEREHLSSTPEMDRALLTTLLWSAKESALKALKQGLRLDTRTVSVERVGRPTYVSLWSSLRVRAQDAAVFNGWWRLEGPVVHTIVSSPACSIPLPLDGMEGYASQHRSPRGVHASTVAHATAD